MREFEAIIWLDSESQGKRVTLFANAINDAHQRLLRECGTKAKISVWTEDDANQPRIPK